MTTQGKYRACTVLVNFTAGSNFGAAGSGLCNREAEWYKPVARRRASLHTGLLKT